MKWHSKTLDELCNFKNGLWKGKKEPFIHVGVIRNTNFTKNGQLDDSDIAYLDVESKQYSSRKLEYGDLILEKSGGGPKQSVGRVIPFEKKEGEFSFSNFTSIIRVLNKEELDFLYLHRYLHFLYVSGATEPMQKHSTGIRNLQLKEYKEIEIPLAPIAEQKRIVAILDEAFAGIDTAIANTEKNLANARELFESYLQKVFSRHGDGWVEKTLGDVCQFENGDRGKNYPSRSKFVDSGIAFINAGHIDDGVVDFTKMNYIAEENYDLLSRGKIKLGDILFCLRGSLGKFALIKDDIQGAIASSLVIVRPHTDLSIQFLLHYLRSGLCKSMVEKYAGGAAQPNLGAKDLAKFSISVPPEEQQKVVSEKLDALMLEAERLDRIYREKLNSLTELKQSLLQKAFSGELTAEGDKLMDEAVA